MKANGTHEVEYTSRVRGDGVLLWKMKCRDCPEKSSEAAGEFGLETRQMLGRNHAMKTEMEAASKRLQGK